MKLALAMVLAVIGTLTFIGYLVGDDPAYQEQAKKINTVQQLDKLLKGTK